MKTVITKSSWFTESDLRFDASYHLSDGHLTRIAFKKAGINTLPLSDPGITEKIFYGGRSRRAYVNNPDFGLPFIKGADIVKADFSALKFISRKRTENLKEYFLKEGWTLITRSGTIGNTAYVNNDFIGKAASDDIIRVVPKSIKSGFLYAFLSSKPGQALIKHGTYGAVIQHIEPEHIANIPVPIFPYEKQEIIHDHIAQAAELRVEANKYLKEAHKQIEISLDLGKVNKQAAKSISSKTINSSYTSRFEGSYFLSKGTEYHDLIKKKHKFKLLSEVTSDIFRPGIFKRVYVENGILFLGGSDIVKANPTSEKQLSKLKTKGIDEMMLKKHWILVTCGGTIGNTAYVDNLMAKCAASQHILRIVPSKIKSGYLYALLSSKIGHSMISAYSYGSVIPQVEPHHIALIPIPILAEEIEEGIHVMIIKYVENIELAKQKETQAIQMIETEIAQWQQ